jgi:hypothetical protein
VSELRIYALVLKWAREANLQYPVNSVDDLILAFPHNRFAGGGHGIDADAIRRFMATEYFPIEHGGVNEEPVTLCWPQILGFPIFFSFKYGRFENGEDF